MISTPLFSLSLALLCLLTHPYPYSLFSSSCFALSGAALAYHVNWLVEMFRWGVLGITRGGAGAVAQVAFERRPSAIEAEPDVRGLFDDGGGPAWESPRKKRGWRRMFRRGSRRSLKGKGE
jgi:hypothetical protein